MKLSSLSLWVVAVLLVGSLSSACGVAPTEMGSPPSSPEPAEETGPVSVTDGLGRTVQFTEPPRRIVVAGKATLMVVNALYMFPEAQERVVAVTAGNQKPGRFLAFVDPAFDGKILLEPDAGPEQIAPLTPDVVVLRSFMADKLGQPLERLDIPVVYVDLETPEQYFRDLATLGQLLGDEARAGEIQAFYRSRLEAIAGQVEGLGEDQKPRVLLLQYSDKGGEIALNVPPVSWIQTTQVELAGGLPVWTEAAQGGGWTVVNFEQIAAWNPDKIFVVSYDSDSAEIVGRLKADPQWREVLRAVQEGQIYGFAADIFSWDQPDPRWILGLTWLAGKVHPDRFPDLDVPQEVSRFFGQLYGMDEAAIQEHILPSLKGDIE